MVSFRALSSTVQIIVDKLLDYPPHAICRRHIPVILSVVPPEWVADLKTVRLAGAPPTPEIAYYFRFDGKFTIKSRGQATENVLLHIYMALAANALGMRYQHGQRFSAHDSERLEHIATPLVEQVLPLLSRKKLPLARRPRG